MSTKFCAAEYQDIGFNHHRRQMKYGQHIWFDQNETIQCPELVFQKVLLKDWYAMRWKCIIDKLSDDIEKLFEEVAQM